MSELDQVNAPRFPIGSATGNQNQAPMGTPGKRTLSDAGDVGSHTSRPSTFRTPSDERSVDWTKSVTPFAPSIPFQIENIIPPWQCPLPPNGVLEQAPTHHTAPHGKTNGDAILVTHPKQIWRAGCWEQYGLVARSVQAMQDSVAPEVNAFAQAEKDPMLHALGFKMTKGFQGDLATAANMQEVPHRGGLQVDGLFQPDNTLRMSDSERDSVSKVNEGGADEHFLLTIKADSDMRAALHDLYAAGSQVTASGDTLKAAHARIDLELARRDTEAAQARITEIKEQSSGVIAAVEWIDTGPAKLLEIVKAGLDQPIHLGAVASIVLKTFPIAGLERAERLLSEAKLGVSYATTTALERELSAAEEHSIGAMHAFRAANDRLASALAARRHAYDLAGTQASTLTGNKQVGAWISAIPIVEIVVAALRYLTMTTSKPMPVCTPEAGIGFGIAVQHRMECAFQLPVVISKLLGCHRKYSSLSQTWSTRLASLYDVKNRMAGFHEPDDSDPITNKPWPSDVPQTVRS